MRVKRAGGNGRPAGFLSLGQRQSWQDSAAAYCPLTTAHWPLHYFISTSPELVETSTVGPPPRTVPLSSWLPIEPCTVIGSSE